MATLRESVYETTNEQNTSSTDSQCTSTIQASPIIDTILSDVNAIIPNFSSLVSSYRLLVGAAEEIHRIPTVCPDVFERAVRRFDNAGTLIDILLDLLCCKIYFSSEFLSIICGPIDLFRLFANRCDPCDESHQTADQIITLEALRRILYNCINNCCFPNNQVICPEPQETTAQKTISEENIKRSSLKDNFFSRDKTDNKTGDPVTWNTNTETFSRVQRRHI